MRSKLKQTEKCTLATTEKFDLTEQQMNWRKKEIKREEYKARRNTGLHTFLCLSFCSLVTDALSLLDTIFGLAGAQVYLSFFPEPNPKTKKKGKKASHSGQIACSPPTQPASKEQQDRHRRSVRLRAKENYSEKGEESFLAYRMFVPV